MSILQAAESRYATKAFDPTRKLNDEQIDTLKAVLRLSPSSINYQGWHFLIITSDIAKGKLAKSCHGMFAYNAQKVKDAAMMVVLCTKTEVTEAHAKHMLNQEFKDGRFADKTAKEERETVIFGYLEALNTQAKHYAQAWLDKQAYIALGGVLLAAADMKIDSVPIEGFDKVVVNETFDLPNRGFHATVMAGFGFHCETDFNARLPKSRLPENELFTEL